MHLLNYSLNNKSVFMVVLRSSLLEKFPELSFGFSTLVEKELSPPYNFNLSLSVDDDPLRVKNNREKFYNYFGLQTSDVVTQLQVHGNRVQIVSTAGDKGESDGMITNKKNLGIVISSADCPAIFIYDAKNRIISGTHSGWKGTRKKILLETLTLMKSNFNSVASNLFAYISPSICQLSYEVGAEVATQFPKKYLVNKRVSFFLDLAQINYDFMTEFGIPKNNIQKSELCSYSMKNFLHSYRRGGLHSGRALGLIFLKG